MTRALSEGKDAKTGGLMTQNKIQRPPRVRQLTDSVVKGEGESRPELRQAIVDRALNLSLDRSKANELPAEIASFLELVTNPPHEITDEDIEALEKAGYSEDVVFEITISAALGAGLARLDQGLASLQEEK